MITDTWHGAPNPVQWTVRAAQDGHLLPSFDYVHTLFVMSQSVQITYESVDTGFTYLVEMW